LTSGKAPGKILIVEIVGLYFEMLDEEGIWMSNRKLSIIFSILILLTVGSGVRAEDGFVMDIPSQNVEIQNGLTVSNMSLDEKRAMRQRLIAQFMVCYSDNQTFDKINQYMTCKYQEMNKTKTPEPPSELLAETFEKSNNLIVQTKKYYGNSFTRVYDPEMVEKKVRKFLWLKGIYFFILGINDEHRLAMSYFYLPGNEAIKQDFLERAVQFSYPEIPDIPENKCWRKQMTAVMDRLGYDIFNIKKFKILRANPSPTPNP
jgi:hypothetical protein